MTDNKPHDITDEDWANTPPSVQARLAQSIPVPDRRDTQPVLPTDTQPRPPVAPTADDGATMTMPPLKGTGNEVTIIMPPKKTAPGTDDDVTATMPARQDGPEEDDGSTIAMSLPAGAVAVTDDDGSTIAMPLPPATAGAAADDGPTIAMPLRREDDGATVAMPLKSNDDGATIAMPDPAATDDETTRYMPPLSTVTHPASVAVTTLSTAVDTTQPEELWANNIVLQERYRLRTTLGKGGFGAAYLAEDLKLHRGCVVKQMLSPTDISAKELAAHRANFEREASLLVQLNHPGHPNIPEIFDYFSDDSGSYLVMKYIEGKSLKELMDAAGGTIEWRQAVGYTIDVCSALNYMHTTGQEPVLHRDIKPANVLLGYDGRIWLVDFGLAQTKPVKSTSDLNDEQAAGSVGYTPFEQWLGESEPASDVYATGVMLHHLVTGLNPLDAYRDEAGKVKVNIEKLRDLHGRLDSIRRINRKLPKELEDIIAHAAAAPVEQRLSALQLQHQLEVLISGAKNAALFTFKNGNSAKTIPQLVDLCEQNRVEAQGYLYRGDFERWFNLINRNDLAESAAKAIKHGEKGKDALEKFLKLIMPNIFLRRLGKAAINVSRVGLQAGLIILLALILVVVGGTLGGRWLLQRGIANYSWNYYALDLDQPNVFSQTYLTDNAHNLTQAVLEDVTVVPQESGQVTIDANLANIAQLTLPVEVRFDGQIPRVALTRLNGVPLYWVTDNLADGINQGISEALAKAPIQITDMSVNDGEVIIRVEKSQRVAWNPPTPVPGATATPTPRPTPTATPRGQTLLAVFNDLDRAISIEIDGEQWQVAAHDTKVIERLPGTHQYVVRYVENGQIAAQGLKTWDYRAYKWRIGQAGSTFE